MTEPRCWWCGKSPSRVELEFPTHNAKVCTQCWEGISDDALGRVLHAWDIARVACIRRALHATALER